MRDYVEEVSEVLRMSGKPAWSIKDRSAQNKAGNYVFSSINVLGMSEDENDDSLKSYMDASEDYLFKCMNLLTPGRYTLEIYNDSGLKAATKGRGIQTYNFDISRVQHQGGNNQSIAGAPQQAIGMQPQNIAQLIDEKVDAILTKKRLIELEEEHQELMQQIEDPSGFKVEAAKIMGIVNAHAPQIVPAVMSWLANLLMNRGNNMQPAPGIAGPPQTVPYNPNQNPPMENTEQLEAAAAKIEEQGDEFMTVLARLYIHDPDLLTTLNKLADKLDSGMFTLAMIKPMLG